MASNRPVLAKQRRHWSLRHGKRTDHPSSPGLPSESIRDGMRQILMSQTGRYASLEMEPAGSGAIWWNRLGDFTRWPNPSTY